MAKFFLGQRVRVIYSKGWPELAGEQGTILGTAAASGRPSKSPRCEWVVLMDCWGSEQAPYRSLNGATHFCPNSDQLEPIIPPHIPCESDFKESLDKLLSEVSREAVE